MIETPETREYLSQRLKNNARQRRISQKFTKLKDWKTFRANIRKNETKQQNLQEKKQCLRLKKKKTK